MAKRTKIGRPSLYKPEYCEMLIEHLKSGLSFEAFAGVIGVNQDTLHEWKKVHPAFSEAQKTGIGHGRVFWEKLGMAGAAGKIKNFNATVWVFTMKNRFGWRDRQHIEHTGEDGEPIQTKQEIIIKDYRDEEE